FSTTIGSLAGAGNITLGSGTLTTNSNTATPTLLSGNITGSTGAFTKGGTYTLELSGNNNYSGDTTINGGVLKISSSTGLGSLSNAMVNSTGMLLINNVAVSPASITLNS